MTRWIAVLVLALISVGPAKAQNYPDYSEIYVNDYADLLSKEAEESLRDLMKEMARETGVEFTIITIGSMRDYGHTGALEPFATGLFNYWGVGKAETNDGIMMLVARDDRKIRLEVGSGYGRDKDAVMKGIIEEDILPRFRRDQYEKGILEGAEAVFIDIVGARPGEVNASVPERAFNAVQRFLDWLGAWIWAILAPLLAFPVRAYRRWRRNKPRICPVDGTEMTRMGEEWDDLHLKDGQITEESLKSVDYDVWECPRCEHVTIESYRAWFSRYGACRACGFRTLEGETEIISHATTTSTGEKRIDYSCHNCGEAYTEFKVIPKKSKSSSSGSSFGGGSSRGGGASGSW